MKTIGLLGGMSWESSAVYYRRLNEIVGSRVGGLAAARIILHSFNFAEIDKLQHSDKWNEMGDRLVDATKGLKSAGADFVVLATNTMHKLADRIEAVGLPMIHIADAAAEAILRAGYGKVGLLGTKFTMEQDFYTSRLRDKHRIETIVPEEVDRNEIHRIIYEELCAGRFELSSRECAHAVINRLRAGVAEAIVLGCTELPLLIQQEDVGLPVFDTTEIHVQAAASMALA